MKIQPLDPKLTTPEVLAQHAVEFVGTENPDSMLCYFGKRDANGVIIPSVSHTSMSIEELLYARHVLDVHIRLKSEQPLQQVLGGK